LSAAPAEEVAGDAYRLDDQVGFILRQVSQRHTALFASRFGALTATQWAALAKLAEVGATSQNQLGRLTAMDVATINGVVDRLHKKGLVSAAVDIADARRRVLDLTAQGRRYVEEMSAVALEVSSQTLAPLSVKESATFLALLRKLA
jgi:DNA-binding MarR family transcriptional regulator